MPQRGIYNQQLQFHENRKCHTERMQTKRGGSLERTYDGRSNCDFFYDFIFYRCKGEHVVEHENRKRDFSRNEIQRRRQEGRGSRRDRIIVNSCITLKFIVN